MSYSEVLMDWRTRLTSDPAVCHGQVCIKGTRIPAIIVLENLAAGETLEAILKSYPSLQVEDVRAALAYAVELARDRIVDLPPLA
jgi:uncharacterized protein (DUF433 family)